MRRFPLRFAVPAIGALIAIVLTVVALAPAAPKHSVVAQATARPQAVPTTITVTAGKPSELAFKLSKTSNVQAGTITFKVTNEGVAFHDFRLCSKPVATAADVVNSCAGKKTPTLKHGQSATLTVAITKTGKYEFMCTVSGHAQAGMKGLIGIGVPVASAEEKVAAKAGAPATTTSSSGGSSGGTATTTPTTTRPSSGSGNGGDTSGCAAGVTIRTSGAADADGDELGTEPDDNDGCV
jgi:uncharacterized cupredoxin-like copper-binding protein